MRAQFKPWLVLTLLAVAIAAALWGIDFYRHRFVRSDRDLFRLLPQEDATIFYLNSAALRRAGLLQLFAAAHGAEESDYRQFVRETRFDYQQDMDAVAGAADGHQVSLLIRGRFDWNKLRAYAIAHGGNCEGPICEAPSSKSDRWLSFIAIQPDVMGLALSRNRAAAAVLRSPAHSVREPLPDRPVWARISQSVLMNPGRLPVALRIFAISLESANPVVLSIAPADKRSEDPKAGHREEFKLELDAQCGSAAMADTIRNQLELDTKMLSLELTREHVRPSTADLTGLLTAGAFQVVDKRVTATWPIHKELLQSLR